MPFLKTWTVFCLLLSTILMGCMTLPGANERARFKRGETILADCIATKCETLDLDGTYLKDFSRLNALTHVKVLMVSYTNFDDPGAIAGMTQLDELHARFTKATDFSGLANFPNLRVLHLFEINSDAEMAAIGSLSGLEELALTLRDAPDVEFLTPLQDLKTLSIYSEKIKDFSALAKLKNVTKLSLEGQAIDDLSALFAMPGLKYIASDWMSDEQAKSLQRKGITFMRILVPLC